MVIVDGLLMLITGLIQSVWQFVPEWDLTENFFNMMRVDGRGWTPEGGMVNDAPATSTFDYILFTMWQMNNYIPVDHLLALFILVSGLWIAALGFRAARWVIGVLRGSGTR